LPGGQRRGAAAYADVAPALDPPLHRAPQAASGVRPRDVRAARDLESSDLRARAAIRGRRRALRAQRRTLRAGGRARPVTLQRDGARGDVRPDGVSGDRRPVVPAHARPAWVLLVPAAHAAGGRRVTAFTHHLALSVPEESLREFVLAQRWFGAKSRE